MKKLVLILSILILFTPLYAELTIEGDISPELSQRLEKAVAEAVGDRKAPAITISSVVEENGEVSMVVRWGKKSEEITTEGKYLDEELKSLFYYENDLFSDGERLDYVYYTSFSSITLSHAFPGQNYRVVGESGKSEALLMVSAFYDNATVFAPVFLSSPLPGMKIERVNDFSLRLRMFSNLSLTSFGSSLSLYYSSLVYPLIPFVEACVVKTSGTLAWDVLLGARCDFLLSSVWSDIPIVKNLSLSGEVALGALLTGSKASLSTSFAVDFTYTFSRIFSFSLGLKNYDGINYLSLTLGGKL